MPTDEEARHPVDNMLVAAWKLDREEQWPEVVLSARGDYEQVEAAHDRRRVVRLREHEYRARQLV